MSTREEVFEVGDLVWQQAYEPSWAAWDSTIDERVQAGMLYGPYQLRLVTGIRLGQGGVTEWCLADPADPQDVSRMCWAASRWCVLEHATAAEEALVSATPATEQGSRA